MSYQLVRKKKDSTAVMRALIRSSAIKNGTHTPKSAAAKPHPSVQAAPRKPVSLIDATALVDEVTRQKSYHETQRAHLRNINDLATASLHTQKIDALAELLDWINLHKK